MLGIGLQIYLNSSAKGSLIDYVDVIYDALVDGGWTVSSKECVNSTYSSLVAINL